MYTATIGLEIHVQLATKTKMFCSCPTDFAQEPNTQICPVCLGLPGALPVINEKAIEFALKLALALNMKVSEYSSFYRKNYFYPDLPKGYQITQYSLPLGREGFIEIPSKEASKVIRIQKGHIEEDSGKSIHVGDITESEFSFIDFNRSGIPLMEIVTEPDLCSGDEAYEFLVLLRSIVRSLGVSTGDMEKGALRCDVNVSISKDKIKGTKVEIKNLNSFRSVKRAIEYEIDRQAKVVESGGKIVQETRHFDEKEGATKPMRVKEELNDYRYFPEPDLPPLIVSKEFLESIKESLPELPNEKAKRYILSFGLQEDYARSIAYSPKLSRYFEDVVNELGRPREVANFLMVNISGFLNEKGKEIDEITFGKKELTEIFDLLDSNLVSLNIAKSLIEESLNTGKSPKEIVKEKNLVQLNDDEIIRKVVQEVLKENPSQVEQYLGGKEKVFSFFIGQIMKRTQGKANPEIVNNLLFEELTKLKQRRQL